MRCASCHDRLCDPVFLSTPFLACLQPMILHLVPLRLSQSTDLSRSCRCGLVSPCDREQLFSVAVGNGRDYAIRRVAGCGRGIACRAVGRVAHIQFDARLHTVPKLRADFKGSTKRLNFAVPPWGRQISPIVELAGDRYHLLMRGRLPADVILRPADLATLERVFAQVIPEHDTHPDELAMLLVRLFQDGITDERELLSAAEKWFR